MPSYSIIIATTNLDNVFVQVCRIAYEIMQQYHPDASNRFKSLDDIWYYGGQDEHQQEAIFPHTAEHSGEVKITYLNCLVDEYVYVI